ncbi:UDP-N-acetylmuramoyl-L-alanyl-D-glutamate--2,6-diaminopimelate ligase [Parasphingorhabdus flavimaris]|uniref:UDP-N-acetylmuramoyl-L-alanyl-D-glutamate--2,6-diaminopimelate ligase n=1 Tax=Parasphingorhabdus flavimaris TaxID=266812 RepID=A0ABX2MYW1_9SPHN|nr:UDP-N-acetylmuramoyl-L-alanyl-D-glutamate--2,6-diaminopimelate ligase [Parasphingorhabdus flavimaris]NVD26648.1 UDP-N-acetylmuramoyl-L-alanyl-D-glutamate--2,6-diaminopimelate ligase [Parasphingorhabdus flavimaris]|tara:strand:+ start:52261 stop:53706 length:1446 start_codon:yes stop_codon:yes gene_type:complete
MMQLSDFVPGLNADAGEQPVTGFAIDNRKIAPGNIFGAFRGAKFNGEDYIEAAVAAGAIAVVALPDAQVEGMVHIADEEPRRLFARMAARYFTPTPVHVAAVTGTNGKTSTAELTRQLWRMDGHNSASIGTLGVTTADDQVKTGLTTPDIVTFLSNMSGLAREGVSHAIFEASSHGLSQYRTEGLPVRIGAFTNLSRDHLDYHGDMDSYFEAKMRLFDEVVASDGAAVIWADDDPWSDKVIERATARGLALLTVGKKGSTLRLMSQTPTHLGQILMVEAEGNTHRISLPLIGAYQAANILISAGIVLAAGGQLQNILDHMQRVQPVRGRMERAVITRAGAPLYVDYAHTPDALRAAIEGLRPHVTGRLITIFGAGGDRDKGKRPEMGRIAVEMSDHVIVTDDNPRSEDPATIRAEILAGATGADDVADRRAAITRAIEMAGAQDIILLAGKGHEQGQIVGDRVIPFDDVEVARECAGAQPL